MQPTNQPTNIQNPSPKPFPTIYLRVGDDGAEMRGIHHQECRVDKETRTWAPRLWLRRKEYGHYSPHKCVMILAALALPNSQPCCLKSRKRRRRGAILLLPQQITGELAIASPGLPTLPFPSFPCFSFLNSITSETRLQLTTSIQSLAKTLNLCKCRNRSNSLNLQFPRPMLGKLTQQGTQLPNFWEIVADDCCDLI